MSTKKIINTDIYNISKLVDDVKKQYMPDEKDSTLAVSTYGYFGAVESKRLQTQVQMTAELANEAFPARARLERSIITHAITYNIENINAIPSTMHASLAIRQVDIDANMDSNDTFVIDREFPIYIEEYEFHLEYDIIIKRSIVSGNQKVYTAQYDITSRRNPISKITNPYLDSPAIMEFDNDTYVFLNVIVRQVHHQNEFRKLITSNVIDNKTINFQFEDQLVYFEVKIKESNDVKYLTPVFEGAGVPDNVAYYCWYQYIDVNYIRVRFDRTSYMPGLNAEIELLIKTCKGFEGNFSYKGEEFVNLESSKYGYKNISILFSPLSEAKDGKDRKSKKELQSLLPKEALARGALTTIRDLNNYFDMINSESGKIIIQKKIDNQKERTYYAYLVLRDIRGDIVPTNTIDIRVPMDSLITTQIANMDSPRYLLRSGNCFKLSHDNIGDIVKEPIKGSGLSYTLGTLQADAEVSVSFKARVIDASYKSMSCIAFTNDTANDDIASTYIEFPDRPGNKYPQVDVREPILVSGAVNPYFVSIGRSIQLSIPYTVKKDNMDVVLTITRVPGIKLKPTGIYCTKSGSPLHLPITVANVSEYEDTVTVLKSDISKGAELDIRCYVYADENATKEMEITGSIQEDVDNTPITSIKFRTLLLEADKTPDSVIEGDIITYKASFKALKTVSGLKSMTFNLSRGLEYQIGSSTIDVGVSNVIHSEPIVTDLTDKAGFLYTNPYSIVINRYHLYSSFYMMTVNEAPFLHFFDVNNKSVMQFISSNLYWERPFLGPRKNQYRMEMDITQASARDFGLIHKNAHGEIESVDVRLIAVFYRSTRGADPVPYRWKELKLAGIDEEIFTYKFKTYLDAGDEIDNENNLKILNLGLLKGAGISSNIEDYGYLNGTTRIKVYALCKRANTDGSFTLSDLDKYVPTGLDGWTVTNIYDVNNGVHLYHNYADIMGSRISPYGSQTKMIDGKPTIVPEGYLIKSVPVFGFDYSQDSLLVNDAIDALNYRKAYIDNTIFIQENSFGIDFKLFNTYGPSNTFYIIRDSNQNNVLDDTLEFIDRVDIVLRFRMKLINSSDTYTRNLVIKDIKDYIEDLDKLDAIHIPNLITKITTDYKESITYFEFLGFNDYKADVQHIYKLKDDKLGIHTAPEHLSIRNYKDASGNILPNISIYISES